MTTHSCIYEGKVHHNRFEPVDHGFNYRIFMMYLDLDEVPELFDPYWLWSARSPAPARFKREDHMGETTTALKTSVQRRIQQDLNLDLKGPVRLLTHLRYWGHNFNPVSFYYCYDEDGETLRAILAEVNNTPWHERRCYALGPFNAVKEDNTALRCETDKDFHVSPFMELDYRYAFRFNVPGERLTNSIRNMRQGKTTFKATLDYKRHTISHRSLASALIRFPFMTGTIVAAIYWQALRLKLKGCPYIQHPGPEGHHTEANRT